MSNIEEQEEQAKTTGHRGLKFPMSIPRYDKDLLEIFDLLEKGERSFFARSMIRKGINYCIENGIDIFENTSLSRGNPLLTQQTQQAQQIANPPVSTGSVERRDVQQSNSVDATKSDPGKISPQIIREGSSNIVSQEDLNLENMMLQHKK